MGNFTSLREVVEYKNNAVPENTDVPVSQLAESFVPLNLSESEIDALVTFLETALYDEFLLRYEPESLISGQCFPNNDAQSRIDLGCD